MNTNNEMAVNPPPEKKIRIKSAGSIIESTRMRLRMTQVEFGKRLGISGNMVCAIEKGRRSLSPKIAARFILFAYFNGIEQSFDTLYSSYLLKEDCARAVSILNR